MVWGIEFLGGSGVSLELNHGLTTLWTGTKLARTAFYRALSTGVVRAGELLAGSAILI